MYQNNINKQQINYQTYMMLLDHAKQFDYVSDKKQFLKNISPFEHKLVLLTSKRPYDVLTYLDELDLKFTRQVLKELTYQEISRILQLFNSEDKKRFYTNFSDLSLVNQFITQDKNAHEHIDDLTFERKVELINSSNVKTVEATEKVYESMNENEKDNVSNYVNNVEAKTALNVVESYSDSEVSLDDNIDIQNNDKAPDFNEVINEQIENSIVDEPQEDLEVEKPQKTEEVKKEEKDQNGDKKEIINNLDLFEEEKEKCETEIIKNISEKLQQINSNEPIEEVVENGKTI